jgi:NAD-dependent deacetylase sirtuin 1
VKPVANIPHLLPPNVPQIIINRESLKHMSFDVELLGDCDVVVNEILMRLQEKEKSEANGEALEWADLCKEKILLEKIGNEESERLVFGSQAENSDTNDSLEEVNNLTNGEKSNNDENKQEEANEKKDELKSAVIGTKYTKDYLKESSFLHLEPNMYIFHGAEIVIKNLRRKLRKLRKTEDGEASKSDRPKQKSCLGDIYKDLDDLNDEDDDYDEDSFSDDSDEEDETDESDDNEEDCEGDEEEAGEQENGYEESNLKNIINGNDEEDDEEDDDDWGPAK